MKNLSKKFLLSIVIICVAIVSWADERRLSLDKNVLSGFGITTADPSVGAKTFQFTGSRTIPLANRYIDQRSLSRIGGIIFMAEATPDATLMGQCPTLTIDFSKRSGKRLQIEYPGSQPANADIYDWELVPTLKFIGSGSHGLFTYMGYEAEYHPAFNNGLAGVILFLIDNSRSIDDFPSAHLILGGSTVPGFPQSWPTGFDSWPVARNLLGFEQLIYSDRNVDFSFKLEAGRLVVAGEPYWTLVDADKANSRGSASAIVKKLDGPNGDMIRASNPVLYASVDRIAKLSAVFRYLESKCKPQWSDFLKEMDVVEDKLDTIFIPNESMPIRVE